MCMFQAYWSVVRLLEEDKGIKRPSKKRLRESEIIQVRELWSNNRHLLILKKKNKRLGDTNRTLISQSLDLTICAGSSNLWLGSLTKGPRIFLSPSWAWILAASRAGLSLRRNKNHQILNIKENKTKIVIKMYYLKTYLMQRKENLRQSERNKCNILL